MGHTFPHFPRTQNSSPRSRIINVLLHISAPPPTKPTRNGDDGLFGYSDSGQEQNNVGKKSGQFFNLSTLLISNAVLLNIHPSQDTELWASLRPNWSISSVILHSTYNKPSHFIHIALCPHTFSLSLSNPFPETGWRLKRDASCPNE